MAATITDIIFKGSSNKVEVIVSEDGVPVNFLAGGVKRMELYIGGIVVTSDTSRLTFADGGLITLALGDVEALGTRVDYNLHLKIFTDGDTLGKMIIHPRLPESSMILRVIDSKF